MIHAAEFDYECRTCGTETSFMIAPKELDGRLYIDRCSHRIQTIECSTCGQERVHRLTAVDVDQATETLPIEDLVHPDSIGGDGE